MNWRFDWTQVKERARGLSYDDVLIVPTKSEIKSRRQPTLETQFTKRFKISTPIISANMDTITESQMMIAMNELGGVGILHRFMSIEEQILELKKAQGVTLLAASIGVNAEWQDRAKALVKSGCKILTVDIAHGHSTSMIETVTWLKQNFKDVDVIAGNIATPEAAEELIEAGADAIKVGIGPGSMCTTRIITGCGVPQLTAVALCAEVARAKKVPLIADGGIKTSGDIVKAFAAGADSVMLGSMLSGTIETPGEINHGQKAYRGMASKAAQVSWRGELPEGMAPEGESTKVTVKGHVRDVVLEICGGIRSGMSYVNASNINEIRENAKFIEMSSSGLNESHAHGLR